MVVHKCDLNKELHLVLFAGNFSKKTIPVNSGIFAELHRIICCYVLRRIPNLFAFVENSSNYTRLLIMIQTDTT